MAAKSSSAPAKSSASRRTCPTKPGPSKIPSTSTSSIPPAKTGSTKPTTTSATVVSARTAAPATIQPATLSPSFRPQGEISLLFRPNLPTFGRSNGHVVQDDESGIFQAPLNRTRELSHIHNNTEGKSGTDEAFSDTYL